MERLHADWFIHLIAEDFRAETVTKLSQLKLIRPNWGPILTGF